MKSRLFYFDYLGFLEATEGLRREADQGHYRPIIEYAQNVAFKIPPKKWILEGLGTHLSQSMLLDPETEPVEQTAFAMLVILSEYLRPTRLDYRSFGLLGYVIPQLGWSKERVELFRHGLDSTRLFRAEFEFPPIQVSIWEELRSNPKNYWLFVRPGRAMKDGTSWFNLEHVHAFYKQLLQNENEYKQIKFDDLNISLSSSYPGLLRPPPTADEWLQFYRDTLQVFHQASLKNVGLYRVTAF